LPRANLAGSNLVEHGGIARSMSRLIYRAPELARHAQSTSSHGNSPNGKYPIPVDIQPGGLQVHDYPANGSQRRIVDRLWGYPAAGGMALTKKPGEVHS